ncbi:MAG: MotA/TolQ/ExbB proton channel family protein [Rhizobiales bacterium]|nr:MotA/TolQ/ExbB proton channel family protein [Hyphomicrobiales bacterium]
MARDYDPYNIERPNSYLIIMMIFLIIVSFVALILYRQILIAFNANIGLNSVIILTLLFGVILSFAQILRLYPEINWVNTYRLDRSAVGVGRGPQLLAPMATLLGDQRNQGNISTQAMRSILDSIGQRLDEGRDTSRYLIGLLVFLGLLGTFWGLLQTVSAIGATIQSLDVSSGDTNLIFEDLKTGLEAPLTGMGTAFSSSLLGLSGSLVLGFLDLQSGHAQNRFYNNLEDWLSTFTDLSSELKDLGSATTPAEFAAAIDRLSRIFAASKQTAETAATQNVNATMNLAEGIQGLVQNMRSEQQLVRNWMEAQADQQAEIKTYLEHLSKK